MGRSRRRANRLTTGEVDAVVVDQPTAEFLFSAQPFPGPWVDFDDLSIVAVLPRVEPPVERLGMVLELDSPLTDCVDLAIAALRDSGTLDGLERDRLRDGGAIPVLSSPG